MLLSLKALASLKVLNVSRMAVGLPLLPCLSGGRIRWWSSRLLMLIYIWLMKFSIAVSSVSGSKYINRQDGSLFTKTLRSSVPCGAEPGILHLSWRSVLSKSSRARALSRVSLS